MRKLPALTLLCLSTLSGPLACGGDPTGVTKDPGFTADQAESVIRFLAGRMPLYHTRLSEVEPNPQGVRIMTVSSDEFRCDPSYVFRPDDTGWARGVIAPELRLEPGDPRFKTGYLISPGLVVFRVVTVANGPDSVIVEHEEGSHYCQFEDGYGFKNLPREYDGDGGFDLFHPGMLKHVADYDGEHWTGEWSGFFQPVLNTAEKKQLDAECEVRLRGSGPVEWGADRAVVTYSGRVCGHALTLDIDVTAGGRAGGTPGTGVRAPLRLALKVRTIERTPVEGET